MLRLMLKLALVLMLSTNALAHQQQETYTNVSFNQRSAMLEVQHRFYLHDAEHAAKRLLDKNSDLMSDPVSREAFAYYAIAKFALQDETKQTLPLNYVGTELDGKYLWVYQETPITDKMQDLWIKMSSLQEIWPLQINHINLEKDKKVTSVRLHASDANQWHKLSFNLAD
ncbi:putative orphan protein [Shewanella denitrificans OS217]|jgi:hypothetical protein|uniref:Putative orphan protein n=1 Tax=Shewanella denitrificans (strain OS217 / ATCC BAA-1090 / DSM 15013) TaxID=318161 RepID=Q12S75_SHEDO|nr:DUF6702 family protein [Shewanella denitrificans]ABE53701.1 putative orphan protein [Shewanella denitrificans OS217]